VPKFHPLGIRQGFPYPDRKTLERVAFPTLSQWATPVHFYPLPLARMHFH